MTSSSLQPAKCPPNLSRFSVSAPANRGYKIQIIGYDQLSAQRESISCANREMGQSSSYRVIISRGRSQVEVINVCVRERDLAGDRVPAARPGHRNNWLGNFYSNLERKVGPRAQSAERRRSKVETLDTRHIPRRLLRAATPSGSNSEVILL